jgi:hypothetical protein
MKTSHYTTFLYDYTGRPIQGDCYTTLNNSNQKIYFSTQKCGLNNSIKNSDIAKTTTYDPTVCSVVQQSVTNNFVRTEKNRKSKLFLPAAATKTITEDPGPTAISNTTDNDSRHKQIIEVLHEPVSNTVIKSINPASCVTIDKQPSKGSKRKFSKGQYS